MSLVSIFVYITLICSVYDLYANTKLLIGSQGFKKGGVFAFSIF